ncbi:STAS domain-containing protein [Kitasatospora sp. NBC_01250]|uniref:STAS domain-containing protein n=1 Tax=unclassified Kitasatospora TaxID=2633591 RepID=UPI002E13811C|nr:MULTISPECIES: STAS domain-containing protein [unclassified Kitasatospora]WSJ64732.1 STAS domain-containing protein [Kitasatospora sp. NBC_01302]
MHSSAVDGSGDATTRLTVRAQTRDRSVIVAMNGELDLDSVGLLRERLQEALAQPAADRVVVDCRELGFCDSTGLNSLLAARRAAQEAGRPLIVVGLRPAVARVFQVTGTDAVFDIRPDVDSALT